MIGRAHICMVQLWERDHGFVGELCRLRSARDEPLRFKQGRHQSVDENLGYRIWAEGVRVNAVSPGPTCTEGTCR